LTSQYWEINLDWRYLNSVLLGCTLFFS